MARTDGAGVEDCFSNLLRYREAHLSHVPAPYYDGGGKPDPPAQDGASNQPGVDLHAELKRNLDHITAEPDLDLCHPHLVKLLDDLADEEDTLESDPTRRQQVDSTSNDESSLDHFDDYTPDCTIERKSSSSASEAIRDTDLSAENIAYLFAEQAASKLDTVDFHLLLDFLNREPQSGDLKALKALTRKNKETFYENELKLSGGSRDRLTRPTGPENADLGLVLHVSSKDEEIEEFWDDESRTIQLLMAKGVVDQADDFVFAFDWHWRAEGKRSRRRGPCPTTAWPPKLRLLHNTFSATLLEQLPLPLLIVAGACPVLQYRNTLPPTARHVELKIAIPDSPRPDAEIVFNLDFRECGLKRIVAFVDHPSAVFFRRQHYHINIRLDAVFNFFLWLNGKNYDIATFTGRRSGNTEGLRFAEPWKELHEYKKKENALGRHLAQSDYEQSFLLWARKYLEEDPIAILARGDSLAARVDHNFKKNVRMALAKRSGHEYAEYWHDKEPNISVATGPATIKLHVDPGKATLQIKAPWELGAMVNGSSLTPIIKFFDDYLALYLGSRKVFSQSRQSLTGSGSQGKEWDQQFDKELRRLRQVSQDLEKQGSSLSVLPDSSPHNQAPSTEVWVTSRNRGGHNHLHLCIRSKHLVGKYPDVERWDGKCKTGCIVQEKQDVDPSKVPDERREEPAKTQGKASIAGSNRSEYNKEYYHRNKEAQQAKNRAYQERNRAEENEKAKLRMRNLRQQRRAAVQGGAPQSTGQ